MSIKIDWYSSKLILSFQKDECKYSFGHVYHQSADRTKQIYRHFLWTSPFSHSSKVFVVILCIDVIDLIATMFLSRNLWFNWWNSTKSCTVYTSSGYHCVPFRIQLHWLTVSQPNEIGEMQSLGSPYARCFALFFEKYEPFTSYGSILIYIEKCQIDAGLWISSQY